MNTSSTPATMVNLTIDGQSISVPKGTTVYHAAQTLGIELPIFCYQDRMPPFGACRVCLVEVEKMPKLQTSCTLEATEGMVVKTQSQMATEGRNGILEFLLINHPLDCPICDRGGECPLQDNALKFGPGRSRFYEEKRHFTKPLPMGPVLMLDRERCIICARCVRFGDLVAGDHALEFIDRGFKSEVGTPDGGLVESKFIGNTIMICPVGALTSRVYRFRARPWDNDPTPTTCTLCPVGCSMILDSRDGEIMRTRSCENKEVNDIWLCDKGWFGYEFSDHPNRLQHPLIRRDGKLREAGWDEALALIAKKILEAKSAGKLAAWGGNPLTTEENYLLQQLMRYGVGVNHVDHRIGTPVMSLAEEGIGPGMNMPIGECENLSHAVLLGLDLTEEFPVIWLRLKQAINRGAQVMFMGNYAPEIATQLKKTILHAPGQELDHLFKIAAFTEKATMGAIFIGRQYLQTPQRRAILAELKKQYPHLSLHILEGNGNSMGARWAGMRPDLGPMEKQLPNPGLNAIQVLEQAARTGWDYLHVAGADPAAKYPTKLWMEARAKLGFLVVQDLFLTETARQADVVLPTLSYVEKGGSFINIEGRVQPLNPGKELPDDVYSDAEIFIQIAQRIHYPINFDQHFLDTLRPGRLHLPRPEFLEATTQAPRQEALAATFAQALFDQGVRMKHNPHVSQLAKEPKVRLNPKDGTKRGIQDGDRRRMRAHGQEIEARITLDERVAEGTIVLPLGFSQVPVYEWGPHLWNGMGVEL